MSQPVSASQRIFVPRVLWAALLLSNGVYAALLLIPGMLDVPPGPADPTTGLALGAAAVAVAVASILVPRVLGAAAYARAKAQLATDRGPSALDRQDLAALFADPEAARREAYQLGFTPLILALALSEAVSNIGLVLGYMGHPQHVSLALIGLGTLLTAARFPTDAGFLLPLARARGAHV